MKYSGIGGQAVIEGIMMKNKDQYATAVRRPDGGIEVKKDTYVSMTEKVPFCGLPFVRGVFSFADSMILGMRTLSYSASFFEDDEDSEPGKLELWMDKVFGEKVEQVLMAVVMVFSVIMAIGIFMILPLLIANACKQVIHSDTIMAILEGVIRIAIFIAYIKLISRMEDIRRTFMYHGAEHKCINCIEHGMTLTVDHVRESSKQHKRCGTSFLFVVIVVAVLASVNGEKITFLAVCGKEAVKRGVKAGDIIKQVSAIAGGSGGGKPDSAMGGGKDVLMLDNALAMVDNVVSMKLGL